MTEKVTNPKITKGLVKTHSKNNAETTKSYQTSIKYKNSIKLSVQYWNLKAADCNPEVTLAVKNQFSTYNPQRDVPFFKMRSSNY